MYWDADKFTYLPAPNGDENSGRDGDQRKEPGNKKEKVKVAKKIAKVLLNFHMIIILT